MTTFCKLIKSNTSKVWTTRAFAQELCDSENSAAIKKAERWIAENQLDFTLLTESKIKDEHDRSATGNVLDHVLKVSRRKRQAVLIGAIHAISSKVAAIFANDGRGGRRWIFISPKPSLTELVRAFEVLSNHENKDVLFIPAGPLTSLCRDLTRHWRSNEKTFSKKYKFRLPLEIFSHGIEEISAYQNTKTLVTQNLNVAYLDQLESDSIFIIREAISQADNPVMLHSLSKDSTVLLHLAKKAFYPTLSPFPLLHIDTQWKFQAMYDFRDHVANESGMELLVHTNQEGIDKNINPIDHGSKLHIDIMESRGTEQALNEFKFDVILSDSRREAAVSGRQKHTFTFLTPAQSWGETSQRPEVWSLYNNKINSDEKALVHPLSNWSELDIWLYIHKESLQVSPLYFAAERPVIERDGMLIMVDDDRLPLFSNEKIQIKKVRFRKLSCYPLTEAIESDSDNIDAIIGELMNTKTKTQKTDEGLL